MDKKRWLTATGTLLGLVCGLALTQQVAADTNQTNQAVAVTTPTTSVQNVGNDNVGANNEAPTTDASVTPAPASTDNVEPSSTTTAASVNSATNDNALNNTNVITNAASTTTPTNPTPDTTTSEVIATGTWGTSNWDYVHQGDDYTLTFHAGTLGEGHRYYYGAIDEDEDAYEDGYGYGPLLTDHRYGSISGNPEVLNKNTTWITELTQIQFDPGVIANANSSFLFEYLPVKRILGINNLDVSHVKSMREMFGVTKLSSLILKDFDTSNVTDMHGMFVASGDLANLDVSGMKTSNVTDMYGMFAGCRNLTTLDLSNFDTSKVTTMYGMFYGCYYLGYVDVSNFDTSQVTNMMGMFDGCSNLKTIDLSSFDTSQVTNMRGMFAWDFDLQSLDINNWNVSNVTNTYGMFFYCSSITDLDLSNWVIKQGADMTEMFYSMQSCKNIKVFQLTIDNPDILGTNMHGMFGCIDAIYSLDLSSWHILCPEVVEGIDVIFEWIPLNHIVVGPNIPLEFDSFGYNGKVGGFPEVGTKIPGTNKTLLSQHWVATKGYQQGTKYTPEEIVQTTDRDQITTYDWDSEPFIPDRVEKKAVTRTINIHQPDGRLQTQTQTITLKRNVHYNDDDTVDYGDWSQDQWDAYVVPTFAGYQASQAEVPAQTINAYDSDQTIDIYYTPVEQTVTIQYLDDGQEVGTQTLTGYVGDVLTLNYHAPKGYELLEQPQTTITIDGSGQQIIQVAVDHQIQTSSQTKTILRTINVNYPSGMTKSYDQVAVLKQNLYIDQVTGKKVYGTWSTGNWDEFLAPVISGYTASQATVAAQTVTSNDQDQVVDVYYTKN